MTALPRKARWLASGGIVVLAAVLGLILVLRDGGAACAAAKAGSKATFYDLGGGMGNCSFPNAPADDLFVALGAADYDGGAACGGYLDVSGPKGSVRVKVIDSCPPCGAGHIDLSRTAFRKIANEIDGIVPVTYSKVRSPSVPGPVSVRIKEGSSQYWLAALLDNHANPLTSVTINGKSAKRTDYNYWIVDGGAGSGPFTITFSDVYGTTRTVSGIDLKPGVTQQTGTTAATTTRTAAKKVAKKVVKPKPSPSAAASSPAPAPKLEPVAEATPPAPAVVALAADAKPRC